MRNSGSNGVVAVAVIGGAALQFRGWLDMLITNDIYAIGAVRVMIDAVQHCCKTSGLSSIFQCH